LAQVCPQPADVVFVNGVDSLLGQADASRLRLQEVISDVIPDGCQIPLVLLGWNSSAGKLSSDLAQALGQLMRGVSDDDPDLANHLNIYRATIRGGRKAIVVPHSQGNFYANKAFDVLATESEFANGLNSKLAIVAVATPDSRVGNMSEPYTTLVGDIINRVPGNLEANVEADCGTERECHEFVRSYLGLLPPRQRIVDHVLSAMTSAPSSGSVTFRFTGRVVSIGFPPNPAIVPGVGTRFSGSFIFNPSVTDTNPDPSIGIYPMPAPFGFAVTFEGGGTLENFAGLRIRVRNNIGGVEDDYEVLPSPQPANFELRFFMRTRILTGFNSDSLPLNPPPIQNFVDVHRPVLEIKHLPGGGSFLLGEIDSLTN
jgi:hypothetical protein